MRETWSADDQVETWTGRKPHLGRSKWARAIEATWQGTNDIRGPAVDRHHRAVTIDIFPVSRASRIERYDAFRPNAGYCATS